MTLLQRWRAWRAERKRRRILSRAKFHHDNFYRSKRREFIAEFGEWLVTDGLRIRWMDEAHADTINKFSLPESWQPKL